MSARASLLRWLAATLLLMVASPASATTASWAEGRLAEAVQEIEPTLQRWGYPAVAGVVALDYVGVPLPADTMLVAATLAAGRGDLRLLVVMVLAVAAMIAGSQVGFALGRWGGRALLRRLPLAPERVTGVEARYKRWGLWLVLVAPFLDGVRQLNAFIAGVLGMGWWRFTAANSVAAVIWAGAWIGRHAPGRGACGGRPARSCAPPNRGCSSPRWQPWPSGLAFAPPSAGTAPCGPSLICHTH